MSSILPSTSLTPPTHLKPPDASHSHTPMAERVSFAAALQTPKLRPRFQSIPLPTRQYGNKEGAPAVSFTAAEVDAGAKCFRYSLIAKFTIGRPSIDTIRKAFQANWDIKGRATLSEIFDGRHLLVILDTEEDMVAAITCPLRKVQHSNFRLFRYSIDYNYKRESTRTSKWIRLPGLPPNLFHKNYIGAIVGSFATFLDVDDRTKACASMRYARACVEIDVTDTLPSKVWIALPEDRGYWQEIIVEGNTAYCSYCKVHGHILSECRKKKQSAHEPVLKPSEPNPPKEVDAWQEVKGKKKNRKNRQNSATDQDHKEKDAVQHDPKTTNSPPEEGIRINQTKHTSGESQGEKRGRQECFIPRNRFGAGKHKAVRSISRHRNEEGERSNTDEGGNSGSINSDGEEMHPETTTELMTETNLPPLQETNPSSAVQSTQ